MIFRSKAQLFGGHWHVDVFSSPKPNQTFAKLGELVMDERDYEAWIKLFPALMKTEGNLAGPYLEVREVTK